MKYKAILVNVYDPSQIIDWIILDTPSFARAQEVFEDQGHQVINKGLIHIEEVKG